MFIRRLLLLFIIAFAVGLTGCGSDASSGGGTTPVASMGAGAYKGLLSGGSETGVLAIQIADSASTQSLAPQGGSTGPMTVTGTLTILGGSAVDLTGTYDPATGAFSLTGGGYSFTGTASGTAITGSYSGPNGSGAFTIQPTSAGNVSLFCGTFSGGNSGTWNVVAVDGGAASGAWADNQGSDGTFAGTWSNGSITLNSALVTATGSLTAMGGSGTWTAGAATGTWLTAPCQ